MDKIVDLHGNVVWDIEEDIARLVALNADQEPFAYLDEVNPVANPRPGSE